MPLRLTPSLLLAAALLTGCAAGGARTSATTKPTAKPTSRPVAETVTVELDQDRGPFAPRAHGLLRPGKASTQLPRNLLAALGPVAQSAEGGEPPVLVTLGEAVKFDGAFPGDKGWAKWDKGVEDLLRQHRSDPRPKIYEVWKEPDKGGPFKSRQDFFGAWVHTVRLIRGIEPEAVLMGASISKHDGGWTGEFLKVAKEYGVLPDVVSWHEENLKQDVSGHVNQAGEQFWQDGSARHRVIISPAVSVDDKLAASDPPIFMVQLEKAVRDNAWRQLSFYWGFKLTHLFTADSKPRSIYYSYKEYADLANAGRNVRIASSPSVEGMALWSEATSTCRLLLGRNRSRVDSKQVLGEVTLKLKGTAAATAHVRARRIANTAGKASGGPQLAFEGDVPLKGGELSLPLSDFAGGDAYAIEITLRGAPATTRTTTATHTPQRPE
jgi:hypothetical protein